MIVGISNVHTGDLVAPGLLAIGLVWLGYLAIRLTDLCINSMRRQSTMDQHAADAHRLAAVARSPFPADQAPELDEDEVTAEGYGQHSTVASEMTGFMPVVSGVDGAS